MLHYVVALLMFLVGLSAGWYAKDKCGPKVGAIETKIIDDVKKL